jgi:hypothetical protein
MGHAGQLAVWAALKLRGTPFSVDGATTPFGRSHRLVTTREPRCAPDGVCSLDEYHWSTVIDGVTPRSSPGGAGLRAGVAIHAHAEAGQVTSRRAPVSTS